MGILIEGLKLRGGEGGKHLINIFDASPGLTPCADEYWCSSNAFLASFALDSLTVKLDMERL